MSKSTKLVNMPKEVVVKIRNVQKWYFKETGIKLSDAATFKLIDKNINWYESILPKPPGKKKKVGFLK